MCLTWDGAISNQTTLSVVGPATRKSQAGLISETPFSQDLPGLSPFLRINLHGVVGQARRAPAYFRSEIRRFSRHAAGARSIPACTAVACAHAAPPPSGRGKIPNTSNEESRREATPSFQAAEAGRWLLSLNLLRQRWVRTTRGGRHFPLEHGRLARTCAEPRRG